MNLPLIIACIIIMLALIIFPLLVSHRAEKQDSLKSEDEVKLSEWEKLHPNFQEDQDLLEEWQSTLENISGGTKKEQVKNQSKIKKEISKLVDITKELKN